VPQTATTALCQKIYAGHVPSGEYIQTLYLTCDEFLYLQAALKGASAVTPQTLLAGVNRLAGSYVAAAAYANPFLGPPDAYDGASAARVMLWDTSDDSWNFVSPSVPIPPSP
jgi:hypothetical protein